jgi:hypothetical protein
MERANMRTVTAAVLVVLLARSAPAGDAPGPFMPYEDLLQVVAELTWHLRDDAYRYPPPRDPTGHDLYLLSLHRLENWEKRYPGRLRDVSSFARAGALERVGGWRAAADAYGKVAAMDSPLAARAREGAERASAFADAAALPEDSPDFEGTLTMLRAKLDAWGKLLTRYAGTPYQTLAQVEEERLETLAARRVVENRRALDDGAGTAERALRFLIEKHADSKNLPDHILRLGDFYAELARDYASQHAAPLAFDESEFTGRTDRALDVYRKVATWDGAREKPEGQARFAGLDAWKSSVLNRYR